MQSSKGSIKRTCLEEAEESTISGLQEVNVMWGGNFSFLPKSILMSQSDADLRKAVGTLGCD